MMKPSKISFRTISSLWIGASKEFMKGLIFYALVIFVLAGSCFAQGRNYCKLFETAGNDQKTVSTMAILYSPAKGEPRVDGNSDAFFYLKSCNNPDYFARASFSPTKHLKVLTRLSERPFDKNSPHLYLVAFTGKLSLTRLPSFGHLGWMRAEFQVERIDSIKPLDSNYSLPKTRAEAPILAAGESLREINAGLMFYLLTGQSNDQYSASSLGNNSQISLDGKVFDHRCLPQLLLPQKPEVVGVRTKNVTTAKNVWRVRGTITSKSGTGILTELNYDNKFLFQPGKPWKLISSNLSERRTFEK